MHKDLTKAMDEMQTIFDAIRQGGFSENTLQLINNYVNNILDGTENIS